MESTCLKLVPRDNPSHAVEFDRKLMALCPELLSDIQVDEDIVVSVEEASLLIIKEFCEAHAYEDKSMKYCLPLQSNAAKDHIDEISLKFFAPYMNLSLQAQAQALVPIIDSAFYLSFTKLKRISNIVLQVPYFCGPEKHQQEEFFQKFGITGDDISQASINKLKQDNPLYFQLYEEAFQEQIAQQKAKFKQNLKALQDQQE